MSESRQLAAIVFTDIAGYSQAMGNDEKYALELLKKNRSITPKIINDFKGEFLKEMGDGTLSRFTSVIDAVRCAVKIQEEAKKSELPLRIGIHIGDVIIEDSDVLGSGVNIASRIEPLADVGGICISGDVWHQISNQNDLSSQSLGVKELKGVKEPVEIFKLNLDSATATEEIKESADTEASLFSNLMERRFPHIIALYTLLCWGMVTLVSYIVNENMLSPHLINFSLFGMLSLFPTVFMLAYFHGKKGFEDFQSIEKIGIPVNILGSIIFLFMMFSSKDLGATTQTISFENEEGQMTERVIPRPGFINELTIFFFKNESEDMSIDWMHHGFVEGIDFALGQDLFISATAPVGDLGGRGLLKDLRQAGLEDGRGAPFALMQEISKNRHEDTFITGWYTNEDGKLTAGYKLYGSNTAKLISEHKYSSDNIFNIIDSIANQVRYDLELPKRHIKESKFLSVQDLLTNSPEAFEYQIKGQISWNINRDDYECMEYLEKSVELDSTNPWARWILAETYVFTNQLDKAMEHYKAGFKHAYKFTDGTDTRFKGKYYQWVEKDGDKKFKNTKMFAEMNPYDMDAQLSLVSEHYNRYMIDEALEKLSELYRSYPDEHDFLAYISYIYRRAGDFENAISYSKQYASYYPNEAHTYGALGFTYEHFGYHNQAIENYEKALLVDPNNFRYLASLSDIKSNIGKFEESKKICEQMIELSNLSEDFEVAYNCLETYYRSRGEIRKSIEIIEKELESANERSLGEDIDWSGRHQEISNRYLSIGNYDKAVEHLNMFEEHSLDNFKDENIFQYINIHHKMKDIEKLRSLIKPMEEYIKTSGYYHNKEDLLSTKGLVNQLEGNYDAAIKNFKKAREYSKIRGSLGYLAETYQLSGDLNNARKYIDMYLDLHPFNGYGKYLSALIYEDSGQINQAKEELEVALDIWANADEDHVYAKKVREKFKELSEN